MMKNFPDTNLWFGEAAASNGNFAQTVKIGKSQPDRMHVRFIVTEACTGGTSLTFKLQGKKGTGSFTDIAGAVSPAITAAKLTKGAEVVVEIPEGVDAEELKAVATASGSFSAGKVEGWIDTYLGI